MELGLKNKYALVTGGSHGIGQATTLLLAEEGVHVAIFARGEENISNTLNEIKKRGVDALGLTGDALSSSDIKVAFSELSKKWPKVDILVNNVGGGGSWGSEVVEETKEEVWSEVFQKNALAASLFTMLVLPGMKKSNWGRVVTVASRYGKEAGGRPWFTMAKSAEIALMKTLSLNKDLVRKGITFNSVAPGGIMIPDTGWAKKAKEDPLGLKDLIDREFPLGRMGTPEEVAGVIVFLCSEKASLINGACVSIDGGESKAF
ncbi:MAG: SDR family oxidoreductase [Anaplasmataceae bacterium]|nr:SDR family oxidoreductase [Anaplasmataceae bacterium]